MANNKIYLGTVNVGSIFEGASDVAIYLGLEKVYPLADTPKKLIATYSDDSTYEVDCDGTSALTNTEVTSSTQAFSAMTSAVIGDCVTSIGSGAFRGGNYSVGGSLSSITLSNSVTSIGEHAFRNTRLKSFDMPNSVTTLGGNTFYGSTSLSSITLSDSLTSIPTAFIEDTAVSSVNIPSGVTSIGNQAFYNCGNIASLEISDNVTTIGNRAFGLMGGNISSGASITIGSGVTTVGWLAFTNFGTSNTASTNVVTINATTPPQMTISTESGNNHLGFRENTIIYVPCESVNAYKTASGWSEYESQITCKNRFEAKYSDSTTYYEVCDGNTSLTSASTMPSGYVFSAMTEACIGDCITSIGNGAFSAGSTSSLVKVTVPNSVTSIGERAFYSCRGLKEINIPSGVTRIENYTFYGCRQLSAITIPNTVTRIGNSVFSNCTALSSVTIPDSVTMIGNNVFTYCNNLSEVTIGSGITSIGQDAFSSDRITSLTINATTPPAIDTGTFGSSYTYPIYVPSTSVETYKTAYNWTRYASRIQAIPT